MPDTRNHRGPDPEDERLFAPEMWPLLRQATDDLCWLLNHAYAARSALELVGNHYSFSARQRLAVMRSACPDQAAKERAFRQIGSKQLDGQELWIDGLNVLTGLEVALSGGMVLIGRDGCCRDIAGLHRNYRKVEETRLALQLVGELTALWRVRKCRWWLDKPVSNTGRLKTTILELAAQSGLDWEADLVYSPDSILSHTEQIVASADSVILDRCQRWFNLVRMVIDQRIPQSRMVDLSQALLPDCPL